VILTEKDRMILTPTFHVFEMYKHHQGAQSIRLTAEANAVSFAVGNERKSLQGILGSASVKDEMLTLSLVNPHAQLPVDASIELRGGGRLSDARISVLSDEDLTAHNNFDEPDRVTPQAEQPHELNAALVTLLPASVTVLRATLR